MSDGFLRTGSRLLAACLSVLLTTTCYHPPHVHTPDWDLAKGEKRPDRLTAQQTLSDVLPASPASFSPDPSPNPPLEPALPVFEITEETTIDRDFLLPPTQFNPDPGAGMDAGVLAGEEDKPRESGRFFKDGPADDRFFSRDAGVPKESPKYVPSIPEDLQLPRQGLEQRRIDAELVQGPEGRYEPDIDEPLVLPRKDVRYEEHISENWHAGHHEPSDDPPNALSVEDRYRVATGVWNRYLDDSLAETPYERKTPYLWHPYYQSLLKGDLPIIGPDIFVSLTLQNSTEIEQHEIPIPSGVSTARPSSSEFYGRGDQTVINTNTSLTFDLFKGETSFKPVEWLFRIQPVFNTNYVSGYEANVISPDPRGLDQSTSNPPNNSGIGNPGDVGGFLDPLLSPANGNLHGTRATERFENQVGLQQFFLESHLLDLSENYDFAALRVGTQTFNADFRGHVFLDSNWGYRLFGNLQKNRIQYNLALFDLFEKESFSELNTFDDRHQNVLVANVYYQDFLTEGYTAEFSFLANWDNGSRTGLTYDSAGNIVRPAPIGTVAPHDLEAYYLGWNGEGHIGRANISHSLYHVFGKDDMNGVAGREVDISAWMAAMEVSVDTNWMRHKFTLFCASGDDDATDGTATGWDAIVDSPNLIGGPFSYWERQGMNLGGTGVALKQRLSLIPDLGSNKLLGQSNFVNPGIFIAGLGEEWELTPRVKAFANLNYLLFMDTDSIATALLTDDINREIGWDLSFGMEYRPLLIDNLKLNVGLGMLFPGEGFKDIYSTSPTPVPGYTSSGSNGISDVLLSGFLSANMTF
ncbi:MAG: hypothetical protein ABIS50_07450 [Luteolibacter sp.]|uniref:hypothetical protein n=1 Tax=Luteolibacter sp. TaxID=1962973 RepID=UPI00326518DC